MLLSINIFFHIPWDSCSLSWSVNDTRCRMWCTPIFPFQQQLWMQIYNMLNAPISDFGKIVRSAHYPSSRLSCSCSGSSDNFQVDPDIARTHTGCHDLNDATIPLTACASSTPLPRHPKPVELSCVCSLPTRRSDGKISPLPRPSTTNPQESTHTLYPWSTPCWGYQRQTVGWADSGLLDAYGCCR